MTQILNHKFLDMQIPQEQSQDDNLSSKMLKINKKSQKYNFINDIQHKIIIEDYQKNHDSLPQLNQKNIQNITKSKTFTQFTINNSFKNKSKRFKGIEDQTLTQKLHFDHYKIFQIRKTKQRQRLNVVYIQLKDTDIRQYCGYAMLLLPNMRKYQGEWVYGTLIGQAKIEYTDKSKYVGKVYRFKKHGLGELVKPNGQKYVGQFCYGEYHGHGKLYNKNGQLIYQGEWRRGKIYQ